MVKMLFSIATAKPSFALILTSTKSLVISVVSPSISREALPSASSSATSFAASAAARAAPKAFIFPPRTGPAVLKLGLRAKFMYFSKSFSNTTFLTLSSSRISGVRSSMIFSYLPSTSTSLRGCLTFIFSFSLVPLPRVTKALTRSILSSTFSSIRLLSALGKSAM